MASRDELVAGLEVLIREGRRLADDLTPEQLAHAVDLDGWKGQEAFAHVAGVGSIVPMFANNFANAPAGADGLGGVNIDQINAGMVSARAGKPAAELAGEIETNYRAVIDFVQKAPDELLTRRVTALGYKDIPLSDLLVRMVILHGLAHIYSVYASVFNAQQ